MIDDDGYTTSRTLITRFQEFHVIHRLRTVATGLTTAALVALGATTLPAATATAQLPVTGSAGASGQGSPAGANNWFCRPAPEHPRPVVLVHGTAATMQETWDTLSPALVNDGDCVYALNYGGTQSVFGLGPTEWGTAPIEGSADELGRFIDAVRARTGGGQVDVVAHSLGGTTTRQYLKANRGAPANPARDKIHTLVMLGPTTHGTDFGGAYPTEAAAQAAAQPPAVSQQVIGSTFLTGLNADNQETFPGIDYTVIASNTDNVITPDPTPANPRNRSFLNPAPGTAESVHNVTVQDACQDPGLVVTHATETSPDGRPQGLLNHPAPLFLVRKALDPELTDTIRC